MRDVDVDRFWSKVQRGDGCWLWTGTKNRKHSTFIYGLFWANRKYWQSHRIAWTLTNGPIPQGLWVLHKCDNPLCVRGDHLFLGTAHDNNLDCYRKGRSNFSKIMALGWATRRKRRWYRKPTEPTGEMA